MSDSRLVYSTDPERNQKCPKCRELLESCVCRKEDMAEAKYSVVLRIEKSGRGGKVVTVADGFPRIEQLLRNLERDLKARCGAGGTYGYGDRFGYIEIQGDKREMIRKVLTAKGIPCKG